MCDLRFLESYLAFASLQKLVTLEKVSHNP